jgi:hypothetical protein
MDARIWHQVSLKFSQIHIQGSIEPQGRRDAARNMNVEQWQWQGAATYISD